MQVTAKWQKTAIWRINQIVLSVGGIFLALYLPLYEAMQWQATVGMTLTVIIFLCITFESLNLFLEHISQRNYWKSLPFSLAPLLCVAIMALGQSGFTFPPKFEPLAGGLFILMTMVLCGVFQPVLIHRERPKKPQETPVIEETAAKIAFCPICHFREITDTRSGLCGECKKTYKAEIQRVRTQNYRAKQVGEPATLTGVEWIQTLQSFKFLCAYCQKSPYVVMEHYIPIGQGAGTTAENCVPACVPCNSRKSNKHPEK